MAAAAFPTAALTGNLWIIKSICTFSKIREKLEVTCGAAGSLLTHQPPILLFKNITKYTRIANKQTPTYIVEPQFFLQIYKEWTSDTIHIVSINMPMAQSCSDLAWLDELMAPGVAAAVLAHKLGMLVQTAVSTACMPMNHWLKQVTWRRGFSGAGLRLARSMSREGLSAAGPISYDPRLVSTPPYPQATWVYARERAVADVSRPTGDHNTSQQANRNIFTYISVSA